MLPPIRSAVQLEPLFISTSKVDLHTEPN